MNNPTTVAELDAIHARIREKFDRIQKDPRYRSAMTAMMLDHNERYFQILKDGDALDAERGAGMIKEATALESSLDRVIRRIEAS